MTNSIASSKCLPSVLTSGNYGMSQNSCTDDSKEYIFVKLTDSAYRAIEEYERRNSSSSGGGQPCAKIQFNGNSGFIHFPAAPDASGNVGGDNGREFTFSVDDVEGSLECIQQTQQDLDVLGSLSYRMRIQANDDVYDTTRTKMAIAEETEKSKCIREIKPNQTDIGRKVKKLGGSSMTSSLLQQHGGSNNSNNGNSNHHHINNNNNNNGSNSSSSYLSNSSNRSKLVTQSNSPPLNGTSYIGGGNIGSGGSSSTRLGNNSIVSNSSSSRSPNPSMCGSGTIGGNNNSNNLNNNHNRYGSHTTSTSSSANLYSQSNSASLTSASSLSSALSGGITNGYASVSSGHSPPTATTTPHVSQATAAARSKLGMGTGGPNARSTLSGITRAGPLSGGANKNSGSSGKLPDISRRKIRERLIHLLALKPFKKPELYSRLQNEGLRDKERSQIISTLKDIATMSRDNTYNLRRQMWNDVNENWPYYSEQELQQLKRRKPQNLTPPLSSDAGSSTSGQSPTSTHTGSPPPLVGNGGSSLKRASLEGGIDDLAFVSGVQAKKQRISHFKKDAPSAVIASGGGVTSSNSNTMRGAYSKKTSYSPHGGGGVGSHHHQQQQQHSGNNNNTQAATDENSGNSDLSYNVLENVDDLMSRVEQNTYYGGSGRSNKSSSNGNNGGVGAKTVSGGNLKDKRGVAGSISSGPTEHRSNKEMMMKKKSTSSSSSSLASPKPYGGSFVPESKSNSNSGSYSNMHQQQPGYKTSNSVIYSPKPTTTAQAASPREDFFSSSSLNSNAASNRSNGRYQQQQQQTATGRSSSCSSSSPSKALSSASRAPTTPPAIQMQHAVPALPPQAHYPLQQQHQQQNYQQQLDQPQQQLQEEQEQHEPSMHASPTQQIADAASAYAIAQSFSQSQRFDFSNYTLITTIEQRRHYKSEFESDYDEYRVLLEQIEGVGLRFRGLAERLENARQGCPDYYNIKQQIVSEYERIRNQETLQRDKLRFDYLHEKLAHIKQLVTDYDMSLTALAQYKQQQHHQQLLQHHQQQQQQQFQAGDANILTLPNTNARLSPMVASGGESSNHSPPLPLHTQQQHSHYHHQQQQELQQHHDAETIQQTHSPLKQQQQHHQHHHTDVMSSLSSQQLLLPTPELSSPSSSNIDVSYNGHHAQSPPMQATMANQNNDSDSDDSSDSNDEDDDDSNSNSVGDVDNDH